MKYRMLGKTGIKVSEIGFGAWAIGGTWGTVRDDESIDALETAVENGINFFDTADVYGDGKSEKLLSKIKKEYGDQIHIATKAGRRLNPHNADGYNYENLKKFISRSMENLGMKELELLQLHCPPWEVYYKPEVFDDLERLRNEGLIINYGVSVEKVEEAIKAIEYPGVSTVQIIFNIFRQRPADLFFQLAERKNVGIITRVPLASGLLTGKFKGKETFEKDDHRNFNRKGESFDRGETFAGVDFETGVRIVERIKPLVPKDHTMAQFALKWILMHRQVSTVIAGAKKEQQVIENIGSSGMKDLDTETMEKIEEIYNNNVKSSVHQYW